MNVQYIQWQLNQSLNEHVNLYRYVSAGIGYLFSMVSILYYVLLKSHVGGSGFVENVHPRTNLAVGTKEYLLFSLMQAGH